MCTHFGSTFTHTHTTYTMDTKTNSKLIDHKIGFLFVRLFVTYSQVKTIKLSSTIVDIWDRKEKHLSVSDVVCVCFFFFLSSRLIRFGYFLWPNFIGWAWVFFFFFSLYTSFDCVWHYVALQIACSTRVCVCFCVMHSLFLV